MKMVNEQLQKKIDQAIRLLQATAPKDGSPVEIAYSGGKDSDVILQLAKEAGINYRAIYKNTTIDPPGTIKHALEMGAEMVRPRNGLSFFKLVEKKGFPSRFVRFCCSELKEYKILDKCVMGVRKSESIARSERYSEPTQCRFYGNKKDHVEAIYPLLEWTDEDVRDFILERGIKCAPVYYDENGVFHVERRLGCIACPLAYKTKRIEEFQKYPGLVKAYVRSAKKYIDSHPNSSVAKNYKDVYEYFVRCLFYDSDADMRKSEGGLFDIEVDYKSYIENYFHIKL